MVRKACFLQEQRSSKRDGAPSLFGAPQSLRLPFLPTTVVCLPTALPGRAPAGRRQSAPPIPCASLQIISLICTNHPGASQPQFFTAPADADEAGGSGSGPAEEAEQEDEGERPRKRQKRGAKAAETRGKAKAKAGAAAGAGGQAEKKKKLGKLEQEAVDRAAAEEAPAAPPPSGGPKATLIACPLSVMSNWAAQIEEHCAGNLSGGAGGGAASSQEGGEQAAGASCPALQPARCSLRGCLAQAVAALRAWAWP